ncbi:MAG: hypothetical protein A2Y79_11145 [Deltaproteobacteria bacterium RBG_13_43_22]|nr:MAG: hypothetical protein A2Y79_11145 [Deltaproteobacteria bacterium RBG_13_43_22]
MKKIKYTAGLSALLILVGWMGSFVPRVWSMGEKGYVNISAAQFTEMMKNKDFVLINVHIPYEGELPGTDLFIPFNAMDQNKEKLPRQKDAKIVVYCRTGRMSDIAVEKLVRMGYTRVFHFQGGMREWEKKGKALQFRSK